MHRSILQCIKIGNTLQPNIELLYIADEHKIRVLLSRHVNALLALNSTNQ